MDEDRQQLQGCARSGYSPAAAARVLALHQVDDFAGVWMSTDDGGSGQGDEIVILHRARGTWAELASGSAGWTWTAFPSEETSDELQEELGVLAVLGQLDRPGYVLVRCGGRCVRVGSSGRHWVALFVGVEPAALNDVQISPAPAEPSAGLAL